MVDSGWDKTEAPTVLLDPVSDLYVACDAYGEDGAWRLGIQSLFARFGDLMVYCQVMLVQSLGFPSHPPPAWCSQSQPR